MMMPTLMGIGMPDCAGQIYSPNPSYDEYARQLALAEATRRVSRSSNSYRPVNPMRVVKPNSASNSPQAMMARRRTLMNDGNLARRRRIALDQIILQQLQGAASPYVNYREPATRQSRPVSWHPSSQIQEPQLSCFQQPSQYDFYQYGLPTPSPYCEEDFYSGYPKFPPTPIAYSGQVSPLANVSPMSLSYTAPVQPQVQPRYVSADGWNTSMDFAAPQPPSTTINATETEQFPSFTGQSSFCWDSLATQGLNSCTTPPTPENFQPVLQSEAVVPSEDSIPYQPLEESEDEGEILVGMGLYDKPDETGTDPALNNYMTTTSHLLGTAHMRGAGLKLEEAWEPPTKASEEDSEEDAEGEEQ